MPLKRDLRLIDEHFESESVDVFTVSSSADKTVKIVDITHKDVLSLEEPKFVMKNNFGPPIIEDWHSYDDSKDELSPNVESYQAEEETSTNYAFMALTSSGSSSSSDSEVFFMATKGETSVILKTFITGIENQLDYKVEVIRNDNGTEFKNSAMTQFCDDKGIKREYNVARTPQQNGDAERRNRTVIEATRT
nr:putative ribonuclease H-like domain-containing protein [Tanacetum cinerariifolium]